MTTDDRFQRNQGVISPETADILSSKHILVAGVGGSGGQVAVDLTRLGIGYLTLADFDVYERHNMNRQVGCFESTLNQPKIDVVSRICLDINPSLRIRKIPVGVTQENASELLVCGKFPEPAFVIEVIDLVGVEAKIALHRACRKNEITIMTGLMLGFGAALHVFHPDAPPYEELYISQDGKINLPSIIPKLGSYVIEEYFDACFEGRGHAPTCVVGATTASAMMISEIMRGILLGKEDMTSWPDYLYVDFFDHHYQQGTTQYPYTADPKAS